MLMYGCVSVDVYATLHQWSSARWSAECGQGLLATLFAHWYAKDRESFGTAYCGTGLYVYTRTYCTHTVHIRTYTHVGTRTRSCTQAVISIWGVAVLTSGVVVLSADGLAWPAVPCRASVNVWYVGVLGLILVRVQ